MKKINFKILLITSIMCLIPIAFGLMCYDSLPENIAIHFDVNSNPDNFARKEVVIFGIPVLMMLIQIFCCVITDLKDENPESNKKAVNVMKWIIPTITTTLYISTLIYAMNAQLDIRMIVMLLLGVMFIIVGNYVPKVVGKQNINFHFRMVEIQDEKLNNKIKRITGYILILNGFLFILSVLFKPAVSVAIVILVILQAIILGIYTIVKSKKQTIE